MWCCRKWALKGATPIMQAGVCGILIRSVMPKQDTKRGITGRR
jgi:hypothetical protein